MATIDFSKTDTGYSIKRGDRPRIAYMTLPLSIDPDDEGRGFVVHWPAPLGHEHFNPSVDDITINGEPILEGATAEDIAAQLQTEVFFLIDTSTQPAGSEGEIPDVEEEPGSVAGHAKLYSRLLAGRQMLHQKGEIPISSYPFQPALFSGKIGFYTATGSGTNNAVIGINAVAMPAGTGVNVGTTSLFSSIRRINFPSAATTAGSSGGVRNNVPLWFRGTAPGVGGFFMCVQAGIAHPAPVATARGFVGMYSLNGIIANVEPSSLTDMIGFGFDSGEANWSFMHNDASGAATKIPLGDAFPAQTISTDWYWFMITAPAGSDRVYYHIINRTTLQEVFGYVDTNLPDQSKTLSYQIWHNNGTTALLTQMAVSNIYIESEN